jgi:PAS domain S-box-containing protein
LGGEVLGTVYLREDYDVMSRVSAYLGICAFATFLSLIAALALSKIVRTGITQPLEAMAKVAREVVNRQDYSLRASRSSNDEIGLVVLAFNNMLDEVQARARALEQSNSVLKTEVAARQTTEAALARATARLESTMTAAEIGSWVWDLRTNKVTVDSSLSALLGLTDEKPLAGDLSSLRSHIHADDLSRVVAAETEAVRSGELASTEFRVMRTDGSVRWVSGRGKVQFDSAGVPVQFTGLLIDITAQKTAERALRESERLYRAIGESMDYGVWLCDAAGRNVYTSESFLKLTGLTQEQVANDGWVKLLHPEDAPMTLITWHECLSSGRVLYREHRILGADNCYHPVLVQGVPIRDDKGEITRWAGINLDISRLKLTEEALREADRRKDEFLATLAHELRNPLAPIRNAVRVLEVPAAAERDRQWSREVIARQVQRMALLLDDLLDVSRITRGRLELKRDHVALTTLVASAIETARPLIDAKHHVLELTLPGAPLELFVDPLRLSQALSNLLTNAAKYTDPGGHINVRAVQTADALILSVSDTGIGFNQAVAPKLFEMFSQLDSAIDRAEGGLGIGLALVKGLISLHGGTVGATSVGPGRGSEFTISLPRSVVVVRDRGVQPVMSSAPMARLPRCKVLVVDDNRDAADGLAILLRMSCYDVHVAHTGVDALVIAAREQPDVVILDIGMPGVTGYEVARDIREQAWGRNALLVAVTGWGHQSDKERSRAAGFDHHLTKPVAPGDLENLLARFLGARRQARTTAGVGDD